MNRLDKVEYCMSLDSLQENPEFLRAGGTVGAIVRIKKIIGSRVAAPANDKWKAALFDRAKPHANESGIGQEHPARRNWV